MASKDKDVKTSIDLQRAEEERKSLQEAMGSLSLLRSQPGSLSRMGIPHHRLTSEGIKAVGPYSTTIGLPAVPVIHPYNPLDGPRVDTGIPRFSLVARLPGKTQSNLPDGVMDHLQKLGVGLDKVDTFIVFQNKPWRNIPLNFRPHPWLHPTAPESSITSNYSVDSPVSVAFTSLEQSFKELVDLKVTTHGHGVVVFSPDNMQMSSMPGVPADLCDPAKTQGVYSFCFDKNTKRVAVTFHCLLNDSDQEKLENIVRGKGKDLKVSAESSTLASIQAQMIDVLPKPITEALGTFMYGKSSTLVSGISPPVPAPTPVSTSIVTPSGQSIEEKSRSETTKTKAQQVADAILRGEKEWRSSGYKAGLLGLRAAIQNFSHPSASSAYRELVPTLKEICQELERKEIEEKSRSETTKARAQQVADAILRGEKEWTSSGYQAGLLGLRAAIQNFSHPSASSAYRELVPTLKEICQELERKEIEEKSRSETTKARAQQVADAILRGEKEWTSSGYKAGLLGLRAAIQNFSHPTASQEQRGWVPTLKEICQKLESTLAVTGQKEADVKMVHELVSGQEVEKKRRIEEDAKIARELAAQLERETDLKHEDEERASELAIASLLAQEEPKSALHFGYDLEKDRKTQEDASLALALHLQEQAESASGVSLAGQEFCMTTQRALADKKEKREKIESELREILISPAVAGEYTAGGTAPGGLTNAHKYTSSLIRAGIPALIAIDIEFSLSAIDLVPQKVLEEVITFVEADEKTAKEKRIDKASIQNTFKRISENAAFDSTETQANAHHLLSRTWTLAKKLGPDYMATVATVLSDNILDQGSCIPGLIARLYSPYARMLATTLGVEARRALTVTVNK